MRYVGPAFLGVAALTLVLASLALNWSFWTAEAATPSKAAIDGAVSLAVDLRVGAGPPRAQP